MSDTPRTDDHEYEQPWTGVGPDGVKVVEASFARELERENAELRSATRWIPVTERLPEYGQFILAKGPGLGNYIGGPEVDICLWDGELWNEGGTERAPNVTFTHWMPLPQ